MASISTIKTGQTLYTVQRQKMGNTTITYNVMHRVTVQEVDPDGRFVIASWNGNAPRKFAEAAVAKWRVKEPQPKKKVLGMQSY